MEPSRFPATQVDYQRTQGLVNDRRHVLPPEADPLAGCPEYQGGGCVVFRSAHTPRVEMSVPHSGFTTAWTPNRATPGGPGLANPDLDVLSVLERNCGPTFAAIASRSYHPGGALSLLADGSVRFVPQTIAGSAWRALGTVVGGEVVPSG